ncbi:zinc knuckle, partial [Ostertagia ostertagi]
MEGIDQRLTEIVIHQKLDVELLLDSQINAMVQLKRAVDGLIRADEMDEIKMDEENFKETHEPEEVTNAKRRLQELESIEFRSFGRKTLLVRDDRDTPKCSLCSSVGEHDPDMCYRYKTVAERKRIVENSALCKICLQLCPSTCILPSICDYCGSGAHNKALCELPEEKFNCLEIVRRPETEPPLRQAAQRTTTASTAVTANTPQFTTHITNIEKLLESLKQAQSGMEELFKTLETQQQIAEESSYEEYMDAAVITTSNAEEALIKLSEKQTEINTRLHRNGELEERRRNLLADNTLQTPGQRTPMSHISSLQAQGLLPRLQLPRFSGNKREWDAFWAVFKANIEDQPIPLMMKYNYLLQTLTGEARQVASRYQISEDNYPLVIEALKHKYGQRQLNCRGALRPVRKTVAKGPATAQQISLLDQISAIMAQLATKGQDTNHRLLLNTVLKKFESGVQLKALEKREQLETTSLWTWPTLYNHLSSILELKERIEQSQKNIANRSMAASRFSGNTMKRSQQPCIYCKRTNHSSKDCRTIPITERVSFLNRNKLCLNCAKANHNVRECRSQGCFRCGQKHHSTTPCRDTPTIRPSTTRPIPSSHSETASHTNASTRTVAMRSQRRDIPSQGTQNVITLDNNHFEDSSQSIEEETQINQ